MTRHDNEQSRHIIVSSTRHNTTIVANPNQKLEPQPAAQSNPSAKMRRSLQSRIQLLDHNERTETARLVVRIEAQRMCNNFSEFVKGAWHVVEPGNPLNWGWHIEDICEHLQAVTEGQIKRLLINIPPGHSKSLLASVLWPVWNWLRRPQWRVMCASYALDLALRDSVKCCELIQDSWFRQTFQPEWSLSPSQNSKGRFKNILRGERMCLSVGSRTTGFRGDCVLIDDPLNFSDAMSDTKRPKANIWLDQAASNRLNDLRTGTIVIIMQRLHHEDVSGRVLEQGGYEHLCLPSRFDTERRSFTSIGWSDPRQEQGELLFPEMFPNEVLDIEEQRMGRLAFAGQHQQSPTPELGNLFEAHMFCPDEAGKEFWAFPLAKVVEAYFSFDTALKTNTHNDFTAGCLVMRCQDDFTCLLPIFYERIEAADIPRVEYRPGREWFYKGDSIVSRMKFKNSAQSDGPPSEGLV